MHAGRQRLRELDKFRIHFLEMRVADPEIGEDAERRQYRRQQGGMPRLNGPADRLKH